MEELVKNTTDSGKISEEYKIPTLSEENNDYWRDYDYGKTQEKLRIGREVEGNTGGGIPYIGQFTITGTGNISVTGVPYKPSLVQMWLSDNASSSGFGAIQTGKQFAQNYNASTTSTSYCILNGSPLRSRGFLVSIDSNGFTVNVDYHLGGTNIVNFICFP